MVHIDLYMMKMKKWSINMELLLFWFSTVMISFAMFFIIVLRMLKYMADNGYKLYIKNSYDNSNNTLIYFYIPIFNIMYMLKMSIDFSKNNQFLLDELSVLGYLEEMTEYEKEEYNKKPTGFQALLITINII